MLSKEVVTSRVRTIRLRTWTLSLTIIVLLALYIFVTLSIKSRIDWIDFAITAFIQISTHFAYFPDGERYGESDKLFIAARKAYNENAARITRDSSVEKLREFCDHDFADRKERYICDSCGKIGISYDEYKELSQKSKKELSKIEVFEFGGRKIHFTYRRRRALIKIIYGRNPVKPNSPDTILSAVDRDYSENIKDDSAAYKRRKHAIKLFRSIVVGGILAYIAYNTRDGLSLAAIIKSCVFIGSMITTAVSSYISGEKASREYKKKFFVELSIFIDKFFSWQKMAPTVVTEEESTD